MKSGELTSGSLNCLSRSRAYELISIADGKGDEVRSKARTVTAPARKKGGGCPWLTDMRTIGQKAWIGRDRDAKGIGRVKFAVDVWLARMDEAIKQDAVAYAINKDEEVSS